MESVGKVIRGAIEFIVNSVSIVVNLINDSLSGALRSIVSVFSVVGQTPANIFNIFSDIIDLPAIASTKQFIVNQVEESCKDSRVHNAN